MKKHILLVSTLLLMGCGNSLLSDDFKKDIDQILPIIENAHQDQEEYSESELDLLDRFKSKYQKGQYLLTDEEQYYEMNDTEKAIFHKVITMSLFAVDIEGDERVVLASEEDLITDFYKEAKEELDVLFKVKNDKDLPEEYEGQYPTYEIVKGIYPKHFEKDLKELIDLFEPIVNGTKSSVENEEWYPLEDFLNRYKGDGKYVQFGYEWDGKHYINNSFMERVIKLFDAIKNDIDDGWIDDEQIKDFNYMVDDLEMFSTD